MSASTSPTALVERWLGLAADPGAVPAAIAALLHPDARFVEHPNLVNPNGQDRGLRVVTRATWTGTLAVDAGPLRAGTTLHAECSIHLAFRDGRIVHQENFDCYRPLMAAPQPGFAVMAQTATP